MFMHFQDPEFQLLVKSVIPGANFFFRETPLRVLCNTISSSLLKIFMIELYEGTFPRF